MEKKKELMLAALEESLGIVTTAVNSIKASGVTNICRATHYNWCAADPEYKKAVEDIVEIAIDFAESKLHEQIKEGDTAATIFYLKCKGKKRGYVERQEFTGADGAPIVWNEVKTYKAEPNGNGTHVEAN